MTNAVTLASLANSGYLRNRIINGAMQIDQRNAGAAVTPTNTQYTLDRWQSQLSASSKYSIQQSTTAPAGYSRSLLVTSLSSYSVGASDFFAVIQAVEGFNMADFAWGTANAVPVTLSFQVRSSLTGTFGGTVISGSGSYPFTYTISSANTFTPISINVPANTTYAPTSTANGVGLYVSFGLGVGSSYSGAAGSWQSGFFESATGATSVVGTNGATFYITGVQLEVGTQATPFEWRPYPLELSMCQRYFQTYAALQTSSGFFLSYYGGTSAISPLAWIPITMRTTPTLSLSTTALEYYSYGGVWTATTLQGSGISNQIIYLYCASDGDGRGKLIRTGSSGTGPIPVVSVSAEL